MELMLSENIRKLRKERSLTQEQLAEVLGVTVGAVYKWEAGLSIPELNLIVEMADFFDSSVDALLGYAMKDNRITATAKRIHTYFDSQDPAGIQEAEKALKKYPHDFAIVHESAKYFINFGMLTSDMKMVNRGHELLIQATSLLSQNTDPLISEATLYGDLAHSYCNLGEWEKGVEIYKQHNAGGMYNSKIGLNLAMSEHPEEDSIGYLSYGLILTISPFIEAIMGLSILYWRRRDYKNALDCLSFGLSFCAGFKKRNVPNYMDKMSVLFLTHIAEMQIHLKKPEEADTTLRKAVKLAKEFDVHPDYDTKNLRFISINESSKGYDTLGKTAMEVIELNVSYYEDKAFSNLWKKVKKDLKIVEQ